MHAHPFPNNENFFKMYFEKSVRGELISHPKQYFLLFGKIYFYIFGVKKYLFFVVEIITKLKEINLYVFLA